MSEFKDSLFAANSPRHKKINFQQLSVYVCNVFPWNAVLYDTTGEKQIELNYFILSFIIEISKHKED